jgi:hypothetical protein
MQDYDEALEPAQPPEDAIEVDFNSSDPSDYFEDDTLEEPDFSWQSRESLNDYFLLGKLKAQWYVSFSPNSAPVVDKLGAEVPGDCDALRHLIIHAAAERQAAYLKSGNVHDLLVLTYDDVKRDITAQKVHAAVWQTIANRLDTIGNYVNGQYFYCPRGLLHPVSFLFQEELFGVAYARVYTVLAEVLANETQAGHFHKDAEIANILNVRLLGAKATEEGLRRLRERETVWFPNRTGRRRLYGRRR